MLQLTRYARFDSSVDEEYQATKAQINIIDEEEQTISTLELRDIIHQEHANGYNNIVTLWRYYEGDEHKTFSLKVGHIKFHYLTDDIRISVSSINSRNEAVVNLDAPKHIKFERGDMREPSEV